MWLAEKEGKKSRVHKRNSSEKHKPRLRDGCRASKASEAENCGLRALSYLTNRNA